MNKLFISLLLGLSLISFPSWGANFFKGFVAYNSGDFATALREFTPLAEQGDANAQYHLALMYIDGEGVLQDYETAVKWYRLAAEQGLAEAQSNLGVMYGKGKGVLQDYKTAVKWYRLAAEQGLAEAQYNLGVMYAKGDGVIADKVYAHMWANIGSSNGKEYSGKLRDFVSKEMTSSQLEKAQDLARECVAKNYKGC
jgi:uncharacterized protein